LSNARWQRIEEIFHRAVALAPEARPAYLGQACGADPSLRKEVEILLAHEREDGSTFLCPPVDAALQFIAHYRITGKLGEGGMGVVYRATDTRLGRDVAIKVLPPAFADDPEAMARFEREAKILASLNHPNIAAIYGVEDRALIMEMVEGRNLSGPLPLELALNYAAQIAGALDAAHEKGVVHRDLKPANIRITPDGVVKVLDFGLAKVTSRADSENSTATLGTQLGTIMGTAAYMAPEQARGQIVDKRADIWAFGVVLFEMLTGKRLFGGATVSDSLAAVLTREPDFDSLPRGTPPNLRHLLDCCLRKNPKMRLRDIGDVLLLQESLPPPAPVSPRKWIWLSGFLGLIAVALGTVQFLRPVPSPESFRLAVNPPPGRHFEFDNGIGGSAISPDGRKVAFIAGGDLWIRSLDSESAAKVPGTGDARNPFWSPDQRSIGFFDRQKLITVELSSGSRSEVTSVGPPRGGSWNTDDTILYSRIEGGVFRVPSAGGMPMPVTRLDESLQETAHYYPCFLSDNDHFLYMIRSRDLANSGVFVGSLKEPKLKLRVATALSSVAFVPAAEGYSGYLLFARAGVLLAQRFDENHLRTTGEPESVDASVGFLLNNQLANFSASRTGTVLLSTVGSTLLQMTWLDRHGNSTPVAAAPNPYTPPSRLSHDDSRVALCKFTGMGGQSLWTFDFKRNSLSLVDEDGGFPAWSADDRELLYFSYAKRALVRKVLGSSQPAEVVGKLNKEVKGPIDWSPDKQYAIAEGEVLNLTSGARAPSELPGSWGGPRFSPDGKWLASRSAEGEVVVQDFPAARVRIQISNQGGEESIWGRDMKEFFYMEWPNLMAVDVHSAQSGLEFGIPHKLFPLSTFSASSCDATSDGQRFLCLVSAPANPVDDQLTVLLNWRARLRH
jgi:serine/threonine protein kinase